MHKKLTESHKYYEAVLREPNVPVIGFGTAGTGKTCFAVGAAIDWLEANPGNQVVAIRPNVSFAGKSGFLPGTEREKLAPWIRPIEQNFEFYNVGEAYRSLLEKKGRLNYYPLEFVQGMTFDNAFIIVDECQNLTMDQIRVLMTRQGHNSKMVFCGDIAQISPYFKGSGLAEFIDMIKATRRKVRTIEFFPEDILRSEQCEDWIRGFEEWDLMKGRK